MRCFTDYPKCVKIWSSTSSCAKLVCYLVDLCLPKLKFTLIIIKLMALDLQINYTTCSDGSLPPCECSFIKQSANSAQAFLFNADKALFWVFISLITAFYLIIGISFYRQREKLWMKARSPKLVLLGVFFLFGDSIGNAVIFSGSQEAGTWRTTCATSILTTCVFFYGIMMVYYLRMYRIEQVYLFYKDDL